jgi:hypothetical protein
VNTYRRPTTPPRTHTHTQEQRTTAASGPREDREEMQIRSFLFALLAMFVLLVGESAISPLMRRSCVVCAAGVTVTFRGCRLGARRDGLPLREETGLQ